MKNMLFTIAVGFALTGCAELNLANSIRQVEDQNFSLDDFDNSNQIGVDDAVRLAMQMADGYAHAARQTAITQDIASVALIASAGSTVWGLVGDVADTVLAERVISSVAIDRFLRRGVPQDAITALYDGASRHNCVALAARMYRLQPRPDNQEQTLASEQGMSVEEEFAAFLMILVMREIEYRTFSGLSRELENFGTLVNAFNASIMNAGLGASGSNSGDGNTIQGSDAGVRNDGSRVPRDFLEDRTLQRFFQVLAGCLSAPPQDGSVVPAIPS